MDNRNDNVKTIDLVEFAQRLLRFWWLIAICTVVCAAAGFVYAKVIQTPMYKSSAKIYILPNKDSSSLSSADLSLANALTSDYAVMIKQRVVLESVIEKLQLQTTYGKLKENVAVATTSNTRFLTIEISDPNPNEAKKIADAVCEVSAEKIVSLMGVDAVNVVDYGNIPASPYSPNVMKTVAIAALLGLVLSCAAIFVIFFFDDKIKGQSDVEKYLGLSTLGFIPETQKHDVTEEVSSASENTVKE